MKPSTIKYFSLFTSIITLIFGGIIVSNALGSTIIVNYILLILLGIIGISKICRFAASTSKDRNAWDLVLGLLFLVVALMLLSDGALVASATIGYVLAALAIIGGISRFVAAYQIRKTSRKTPVSWLVVTGIIAVMLGVCLIVLPVATQVAYVYLSGIFLIVYAIITFFSALFIKTEK